MALFDTIRNFFKITRGGTSGGRTTDVSRTPMPAGDTMPEYNPGWKLPNARATLPPEQANSFMGPQDPVTPIAPRDVAGRAFDFPLGTNRQIQPRAYDTVTFDELIALAEHSEIVRLCIETRKDQMQRLRWNIVPRDVDASQDDPSFATRITDIETFLRHPDGYNDWATWLRMILEQLLVLDAPCIFPKKSNGGDLLGLEIVDGATIKLIIDEWGRTPEAPFPAYQQILSGLPAVNFTRDELIYRPRNKRVNKLYGYSPVEQVIKMANIAIRRELFQLAYYTEGTDPQGFMETPEDWSTEQIDKFQKYWDSLLTDNDAARRKIKFVPSGAKYTPVKEAVLADTFDEWLSRVVCFAFSLPPTAFVRQVNRATAESAAQVAEEEGLHPLMLWVETTIDFVLANHLGIDDLVFRWDTDQPLAPKEKADIDKIYVESGIRSIDEVRSDQGLDPVGMNEPIIVTASGVLLVSDVAAGKYGPEAQAALQADQAQQAHENAMEQAAAAPKPSSSTGKDNGAK